MLLNNECPACKRYIGNVLRCPYCDVDIPIPAFIRRLRITASGLATVGFALLWIIAANTSLQLGNVISIPDHSNRFYTVIKPHLHWILWCFIAWMVLSRRPDSITIHPPGWRRCLIAHSTIGMDLLIFLLGGIVGFMITHTIRQNAAVILPGLMAIIGFSMLPWLYRIRPQMLLGFILVPIASDWSGISPWIASAMRLIEFWPLTPYPI